MYHRHHQIPSYFTLQQRMAMKNAASIGGLNVLRLMHNTTATALQYGFYKNYGDEPVNVAFLDMGFSSFEVRHDGDDDVIV